MGIVNLMSVIKEISPNAIYSASIVRFRGQPVAIDISVFAHQKFREILPLFVREDEEITEKIDEFEEETPEKTYPDPWFIDWKRLEKKWLLSFFDMIKDLLIAEITPLIIFDGKAPKIKKQEHGKREKTRKRSEELYEIAKKEYYFSKGRFDKNRTREKCKKAFMSQTRFNFNLLSMLKDFFIKLNLPVFQCVEESDYLIASLAKDGIIKACMSVDTDLIIYGVDFLLTDFRRDSFKVVNVKKFTEDYGGRDKLLDLAILLGTDYNDGIPGVGKKTAMNLLDEYGKLELFPHRFYRFELNRTIIRDRFTNIKAWRELIDHKFSNLTKIEKFEAEQMKAHGIQAFITYGIGDKWSDCIDGL